MMSSIEAREPSFMTCVLESIFSGWALPERVSVFLLRSNFCTFPCSESKWPLGEVLSVEDVAPEPVPMEPDAPVEPVLLSVALPIEPVLESREVLGDPEVLLPLEVPLPLGAV